MQQPNQPVKAPPPGNGLAIASLVLGITSLVFMWFGYFALLSIAMAVVGIILGISAKKKNAQVGAPAGMATAGIVCSIIALALSALVLVVCTICVASCATLGML